MLNFIFSGVYYKNQFVIGKDNQLLFDIPEDLQYFKRITENNIVVMGSRTWFSLPEKSRPLKNRLNLILTNNKKLLKIAPTNDVRYLTFDKFVKFYRKKISNDSNTNPSVFVIGGGQIFNKFLLDMPPDKIYFTDINVEKEFVSSANIFVNVFDNNYKLVSISEKKYTTLIAYRHLVFNRTTVVATENSNEKIYIQLCKNVINRGEYRGDRTGVGTISVFGKQLSFNISQSIPILTTKFIPWKHVIEELLWFIRGDTDTKILSRKGIKIWDGNTSREFLDSQGLYSYNTGILGKGYGWQWRFFGARYDPAFADTSLINPNDIGGFDQLQYVLNEIKTNPSSRRILMCYWNPCDLDKTALPPCHFSCQFYVHTNKQLDCHFTMRSTDCGLGLPFNIVSYAVLTYIIAKKCDLQPGKLVYTGGDVHVYKNHVEKLLEQFQRTCRPEAYLLVNDAIKDKKFEDISITDFDIVGYYPHPSIKMNMAV